MSRVVRRALVPTLLVGWLIAAAPAAALAGEVKDDAHFFRPETIAKANEEIQELERQTGKQLVIHTVEKLPPDREKAVHTMGRRAREVFFTQWAEERARDAGVDGIFVLICKSPSYVEVILAGDTNERLFPRDDRRDLAKRLAPRARDYDQELLETLDHAARRALLANQNAATAPASVNWGVILGIIGALFGLWVVILVVRAVLGAMGKLPAEPLHEPTPAAAAPPAPPAPPQVKMPLTMPYPGKLDETQPYPGPLPETQPVDPLVTGTGRREDSVDF